MRTPDAPGPVRTCVGCRRRRSVEALMRLTRSSHGVVVNGSSNGRGAWLCRDDADHGIDESCLASAFRQRGFARAWRITIDRNDEQDIREHITSFVNE